MMKEENFLESLKKAIELQIQAIVNEEAKEAASRVEAKVRERSTFIATRVLERFSISQHGKQIQILIDFENTNKP